MMCAVHAQVVEQGEPALVYYSPCTHVVLDFSYKVKANDWFSLGMGFDFEYSRIAEPEERPFYYVNGNFKTFGTFRF